MAVGVGMKDLSYLKAFNPKIIREARRIMNHGITVEDIDVYFRDNLVQITRDSMENASPERKAQFVEDMKKRGWELKKPCGGCKEENKEKI